MRRLVEDQTASPSVLVLTGPRLRVLCSFTAEAGKVAEVMLTQQKQSRWSQRPEGRPQGLGAPGGLLETRCSRLKADMTAEPLFIHPTAAEPLEHQHHGDKQRKSQQDEEHLGPEAADVEARRGRPAPGGRTWFCSACERMNTVPSCCYDDISAAGG